MVCIINSSYVYDSSIIVFDSEVYDVGFIYKFTTVTLQGRNKKGDSLEPPNLLDVCELGWRLDIGGEG